MRQAVLAALTICGAQQAAMAFAPHAEAGFASQAASPAPSQQGQNAGTALLGTWREPGGSVVRVASCGDALCLTLVTLPPDAPSQVDHNNPDAALRTRKLCGLRIGYGFHPTTADHADDGRLYDPRAGKTYKGEMKLDNGRLLLRGYVGSRLFGRTETWTRAQDVRACDAA